MENAGLPFRRCDQELDQVLRYPIDCYQKLDGMKNEIARILAWVKLSRIHRCRGRLER